MRAMAIREYASPLELMDLPIPSAGRGMYSAISLLASGRVQNVIDDVLPLERANEALERLSAGKVVGRTVLRVCA